MKKTGRLSLLAITVYLQAAFSTPPKELSKAKPGEQLFHKKILSKDSSISCDSRHISEYGFSDMIALSMASTVVTGSYMHNGMFKTREEEVVAYYHNPGAFVLSPISMNKRGEFHWYLPARKRPTGGFSEKSHS